VRRCTVGFVLGPPGITQMLHLGAASQCCASLRGYLLPSWCMRWLEASKVAVAGSQAADSPGARVVVMAEGVKCCWR
jgi:hypothetical protein